MTSDLKELILTIVGVIVSIALIVLAFWLL
jgi:hypothetical protein